MTKPTPGPWRVTQWPDGDTVITDNRGHGLAMLLTIGTPKVQANAALIAAAPDLLLVLKRALEDIITLQDLVEVYAGRDEDHGTSGINIEIRNAIAKAGGAK